MATVKAAALIIVIMVIALPATVVAGWLSWAHFVQSPRFAAAYFDGLLEIEDVLETRRWHWSSHPWGGRDLGCSYAIVTISKNAPHAPPVNWEADWKDTPVTVPDSRHDILAECLYLWSENLVDRLARVHGNPGSFYSSSPDTLLLYSPHEGLAARIRFGD